MKVIFCLKRLPTLTPEAFQRHWYEVHAPLVLAHARVLRIERYVQVHSVSSPLADKIRAFRGGPEAYDGVAEIWYESLEAVATLGRDPAAREASRLLREDEERFVDAARSPIWIGEERPILPLTTAG